MTAEQPSNTAAAATSGPSHYSEVPQDARLISLIIASMGIQDIEPGVEMMLLEWAHRYVQTILSDSLLYSAHAHPSSSSNPSIALPDLILAIQSHLSHSLIQQPSKSTLLSLASTLNSAPLPPISDRYGLRLPPREQCLTNVNFRIVPEPLADPDDDADGEAEEEAPDGSRNGRLNGHAADEAPAGTDRNSAAPHHAGEDESGVADATMDDAGGEEAVRGVKRSLDEDDDYD